SARVMPRSPFPELVFEADARLVAGNDNRALGNRRLHGFSPANQPSVLYDRMALRARNPRLGATGDFLLKPCRRQRYGPGLHAAPIEGWGTAHTIATCGRTAIGAA